MNGTASNNPVGKRKNTYPVRLNLPENTLFLEWVGATGKKPAVAIRDVLLAAVEGGRPAAVTPELVRRAVAFVVACLSDMQFEEAYDRAGEYLFDAQVGGTADDHDE